MNLLKISTRLVLLLAITALTFSSCGDEETDITVDLVGTYLGALNVGSGTQEVGYKVTVSKVNHNTVKVTPEDDKATEFEVTIIGAAGVYSCVTDCNDIIVAFNVGDLVTEFGYTYSGTESEQFAGVK